MLAVTDIQVIVTCGRPDLLPDPLSLCASAGTPGITVSSGTRLNLPNGRVMLADAVIRPDRKYGRNPIDSVRELPGHVLGLYGENPALVSRIAFMAEDATFVMELDGDGMATECSQHRIVPCWDFPLYRDRDGSRFRAPMYKDSPWTESGPAYGFTRYSRSETHPDEKD